MKIERIALRKPRGTVFIGRKRNRNFRGGFAKREAEERKEYQNTGKKAFLLSLSKINKIINNNKILKIKNLKESYIKIECKRLQFNL